MQDLNNIQITSVNFQLYSVFCIPIMEDEKCKLYNEIFKALKRCYSDQSSDAWTKKMVNLWNKAKEDSCSDLNKLKAEVS